MNREYIGILETENAELKQENKRLNGAIQTYDILLKSNVEENKILKENAENNDKVVDKVNWENMLLKKENKQLKDNWNILKEFIDTLWLDNKGIVTKIKDKMELIEQGSDSNDSDR